jgi:flagellar biosynthetic protein FliR
MVFDDPTLLALAFGRCAGWVASVPIFGPIRPTAVGRIALAIALAVFVAGNTSDEVVAPGAALFAFLRIAQVLYGLLLGWLTSVVVSTFQAAGSLIDLLGGFSISAVLDPSTGTSNAVVARFFQMLFIGALLVSNAHLVILGGFMKSFESTGLGEFPVLSEDDLIAVSRAVADLLLAALEIGAPLVGALLLAEVTLALGARFAPQANIFLVSLPFKAFIVFALMGNVLIYLPLYVERISERAVELVGAIG